MFFLIFFIYFNKTSFNKFILLILVCFIFIFSLNAFIFFIFYELSVFPLLIWCLIYSYYFNDFFLFRSFIYFFLVSYFLTYYFFLIILNFLYSLIIMKNFLFIVFFSLTFIFKAPLFPFFNWLIFLHVYASTFISIWLASFYLKLSAIFFLFFFYLINYFFLFFFTFLSVLCVFFLIIFEFNVKRIIAFGSIFHCSFSFFFYISYLSI